MSCNVEEIKRFTLIVLRLENNVKGFGMKCIVVCRTLPGNQTVVSAVIHCNEQVDDEEHWLRSKAEQFTDEFRSRFVEYKLARWDYSIIEAQTHGFVFSK